MNVLSFTRDLAVGVSIVGALAMSLTALPASSASVASTGTALTTAPAPLQAIAKLDLPRYMGTWYELGRYPNRFQRNCVGGTSATYAVQPDASVRVTNRCRNASGGIDEAVGQARRTGEPDGATLQVRFAPAWLSWLPFVWGTYWVVDLDPNYQLAIVSEPSREYLWVLSRTPQITPAAWAAVSQRLSQLGFDPQRVVRDGP